jgi:hypothetical protein
VLIVAERTVAMWDWQHLTTNSNSSRNNNKNDSDNNNNNNNNNKSTTLTSIDKPTRQFRLAAIDARLVARADYSTLDARGHLLLGGNQVCLFVLFVCLFVWFVTLFVVGVCVVRYRVGDAALSLHVWRQNRHRLVLCNALVGRVCCHARERYVSMSIPLSLPSQQQQQQQQPEGARVWRILPLSGVELSGGTASESGVAARVTAVVVQAPPLVAPSDAAQVGCFG